VLYQPPGMQFPVLVDEQHLAWLDIFEVGEVHDVQTHALRCNSIGGEHAVFAFAVHQWFDPVGISEGHHPLFRDIGHH